MCDGYAPFAMAFVTKDIDTTGYEIALSAVENGPKVPRTTPKSPKRGKTLRKRLMGLFRRF